MPNPLQVSQRTSERNTPGQPCLSPTLAAINSRMVHFVRRTFLPIAALAVPSLLLLLSDAAAATFDVVQTTKLAEVRPQNMGFGVLALYSGNGPTAVRFDRTAAVPTSEPLVPTCRALVYGPDGSLVGTTDLTNQVSGSQQFVINLPAGPPGIYHFSLVGGRVGETVSIAFPQPQHWGVRGEMPLSLSATTPSPAYLYLPRTTKLLYLRRIAPSTGVPDLQIRSASDVLLSNLSGGGTKAVTLNNPGTDTVVKLVWSGPTISQVLLFEGAPPVLCPTAAAAQALKGGVVEASGLLVSGPLAARAREHARQLVQSSLADNLVWPAVPGAGQANPLFESLIWGSSGPLSSLDHALPAQILEAASPYLGVQWTSGSPVSSRESWENFIPGSILNPFDAAGYAIAYKFPGALNPAKGNTRIRDRAILAAFYHFISMPGDHLLRDSSLTAGDTVSGSSFFTYDTLASPLVLLRDDLPADIYATWKQCLMAVADRSSNTRFYASNQWSHMMICHLHTYLATDEPRFLELFERQMTAFADGAFGPADKYGQHPAGFYLEEYGPDGNYDHLSSYVAAEAYYTYKDLPEANPVLVNKMAAMIQKNLVFKSFYWNPQPDGSLMSPTAFNCRTDQPIVNATHPGDSMTARDFDLGFSRWKLTVRSGGDNLFPASVYPFLANTDAWSLGTLQKLVGRKGNANTSKSVAGTWVPGLQHAFTTPPSRTPAVLPHAQPGGLWTLPGQVAFNQGGLYGVVFYDVAGATNTLPGHFGGGPTLFWSAGTGLTASSMRNSNSGNVTGLGNLTHSCVYATNGSSTVWTGKERATLEWVVPDKIFEIHTSLSGSALTWRYTLMPDSVRIQILLEKKLLTAPSVNLPLYQTATGAANVSLTGSTAQFEFNNQTLEFVAPSGVAPSLTSYIETKTGNYGVRNLRVPLTLNGSTYETTLTIRKLGGGLKTSFAVWAYDQQFSGAQAEPDADPDADGVRNLMEYALGGDPHDSLSRPSSDFHQTGEVLSLSYPRASNTVTYLVETSASLEVLSWTTQEVDQGSGNAGEIITATTPVKPGEKSRFLRLRISE